MHAILKRLRRILRFAAALFPVVALAGAARADIFQWEYINPADPSQGKQQSTTLTLEGAGVDAVPGANLFERDLTMAYLIGADLKGANGPYANLTNADLSQANLTGANFWAATLSDANFSGAELRRATIEIIYDLDARRFGTGISLNQLYSTASYQRRDLSGINLTSNNLAGSNLDGQNLADARFWSANLSHATLIQADLTNVRFDYAQLTGTSLRESNLLNSVFLAATLTDADFTGAEIKGANFGRYYLSLGTSLVAGTGIAPSQLYSTANYQSRDLSGIHLESNDLTGANFAGQNLSNTSLYGATLTGADFTDATVCGTDFGKHRYYGTGITLAQLFSTASYNAHNLRSVGLVGNDLSGGDFSAQNLTNANLGGATLADADFTAADARGAILNAPTSAVTINLIRPNGRINGLVLDTRGRLVVRDYDGDSRFEPAKPSIPITVEEHLAMGPGGTLQMVFEADAWDSTISFAPGIRVALGGTLELTFADKVNLASQVGRKFDLFDWIGVNPTGAFAVSSHYTWDLSELYTTGQVTFRAVPESACLALAVIAIGIAVLSRRRCRIRTPIHVAQSQTICGEYA